MTRGCRDLSLSEHDLMGQNGRVASMIDRHSAKKPQPAFLQITPKAFAIQGSGRAMPSLWDGCDFATASSIVLSASSSQDSIHHQHVVSASLPSGGVAGSSEGIKLPACVNPFFPREADFFSLER